MTQITISVDDVTNISISRLFLFRMNTDIDMLQIYSARFANVVLHKSVGRSLFYHSCSVDKGNIEAHDAD